MSVCVPASAEHAYTVKPGQTLSAIAHRFHIDASDLAAANGMKFSQPLRAGQMLQLPPPGVTYVSPGQTLSHIARAHHCSVEELRRLNGLGESSRLHAGARLTLPGYMPAEARDRDWGEPERPGHVTFVGQDGKIVAELVDAEGRVRLKGLRILGRQMNRDENDPSEHVHPRLAVLLAKISDHFGGRDIHVVSGFRKPGGYTLDASRHVAGRAADIQVEGVPRSLVWDYCRSLAQTGCGFYPNSVFVHVDVREQEAQWVDWSGPGKRPRYGTLRRAYRRREQRNPERPRVARKVTRPDEVPLTVRVVNRHNQVVRFVDEHRVDGSPASDQDARMRVSGDHGSEHTAARRSSTRAAAGAPRSI